MARKINYLYLALVTCVLAALFYPMFLGQVLIGDDFKPQQGIFLNLARFYGEWSQTPWLGYGFFPSKFTVEDLFLFLLPDFNGFSTNMTYVMITILALLASYYLFKSFRFAKFPALLGSLMLTFSPLYYSYVRTGHLGKMYTVIYFAVIFALINKIWYNEKETKLIDNVFYSILAALSLTLALFHNALQTYAYFFPVLTFYCLFLFFNRENGKTTLKEHLGKHRQGIAFILLIPFVFLFLGYSAIDTSYVRLTGKPFSSILQSEPNSENGENGEKSSLKAASEEQADTALDAPSSAHSTDLSKKDRDLRQWDWATQWSLPKLETLDFFVPGIFGFLSNDPENPYWGGVGRSLSWSENRQGIFNYSLASNYFGIFLSIFLFYSLFFVKSKIKWLWLGLILMNLFLSYGRYFPLYEYFYNLPSMEKLRNPNKFLLILHFCVSVLAAYGVNHFYQKLKSRKKSTREAGFFKKFLIFANVVLILGMVFVLANENNLKTTFNGYFNNNLTVNLIYENIIFYVVKALVFYNLALYLLFYLASRKWNTLSPKLRNLAIAFACLLLLDQFLVNRHYFNFQPPSTDKSEYLTNFFKQMRKEQGPFRVKIVSPDSPYLNYFKWNLAIPNDIELMEYWAIRTGRLPQGDLDYLTKINNRDLRVYKLANVKYLLSNRPLKHPEIFLVESLSSEATREEIFIYQVRDTLERFYLADDLRVVGSREAELEVLNSNEFKIHSSVVYNLDLNEFEKNEELGWLYDYRQNQTSRVTNGSAVPETDAEETGALVLLKHDPQEYEIEINIKEPKILVFLNGGNPDWRAYHEGQPIKERHLANYYFNSYLVKPEMRRIKVKFGKLEPIYPKEHLYYLLFFVLMLAFLNLKTRIKP